MGGGLLFPEPPPLIGDPSGESDFGSLATLNLRFETGDSLSSWARWDLALMMHGQWERFPGFAQDSNGALVGGSSSIGIDGRVFQAQVDGKDGDLRLMGDVDRLNVSLWAGELEFVLGRQAISWARSMVFQPLDIFGPFSVLTFDTEAKVGVDAIRARIPVAQDATLDLVLNADESLPKSAFAARLTMLLGRSELGFSGGLVRDEWLGAFDGVLSLDLWSLRWEAVWYAEREAVEGLVCTLGFDRFLYNGDLQVFGELLYDGRGAIDSTELAGVFLSEDFIQGRMKVPGRYSASLGARYQVSALWNANLSVLTDLHSPSGLIFAQVTRSLSDNMSLDAIVYQSIGKEWSSDSLLGLAPGSSFGLYPSMAGLYLRMYR